MPAVSLRLVAAGLGLLVLCAVPWRAHAQETYSPVVVVPVVQQQVRTGHRVVGTVTAARTSIVGSAVDGRVVEYLVRAGEQVGAGQPLARLRTGTLEIELAAANAELAVRDAELQLAEIQAAAREQDIAEAEALARRAQIVYEISQRKLQRSEQLLARSAINQNDHDDLLETALAAEQSKLAAAAALARTQAGPGEELIAQARARRSLQHEQVRLIEDRLAKYQIVAPYDGFVATESTQQGEWVQQGDPIAEIIQLDEVDVVANVPTELAVQLMLGETVRVEFSQLPDRVLTGSVARIVPTADVRTRTYPVHVRMSNPIEEGRPLLMAGMLARIDLPSGTLNQALLVPKDALVLNQGRREDALVLRQPGEPTVFVVETTTDPPQVRSVGVTLGVAVEDRIAVEGNLQPGDLVVTRGNERLSDGQGVTIREGSTAPAESR